MFNPWALLFHIVCLFVVLRSFFYWVSLLIAQELPISSLVLVVVVLKSQISEYEFCTFLLVRVVFLDGLSSCVHPFWILCSCRRVTRTFYGINGSERSCFFFALAILKVNIFTSFFVTLRNLFSRILHTIFSEPIYGLSIFSCFIHFACCSSSSSYSLALLAPKCTC